MTVSRNWVVALATAALAASPTPTHAGPGKGAKAQVVEISVTGDGFVPARATVKAGQPVTLVVTRKVERTCATDIVLKDPGIKRALPLNQPVEVTFTPSKPGTVRYACAMDMIAGALAVE
jgi:plastocyanin domain-containing protein